ncbi:helix-turn-helix transcriptional regulator [Candidatus Poribacteria bacterium]|jgi:transcriptional regulator with XRE-family HTH domain|nr:helix-turn-helix transcriptional regulator [Candidatus Poribacteria bacterium]
MQKLAQKIRLYRAVGGPDGGPMSQEEFGKLVDLGQTQVSRLELGRMPSTSEVIVLARVLGCTTDEIVAEWGVGLES